MAKKIWMMLAALAAMPLMAHTEAKAQVPDRDTAPGAPSAGFPVMTLGTERDYRAHFSAARSNSGQWADESDIAREDGVLLGHVLFARYTDNPEYKPKFNELSAWLERFSDHPGADRIYALALDVMPAGAIPPKPPELAPEIRPEYRLQAGPQAGPQSGPQARSGPAPRRRAPYDPIAQRFVERAEAAFHAGDDARAIAAADAAGETVMAGAAGMSGGLAAFRQSDFEAASAFFTRAAEWPWGDSWRESAAHYWAARALLAAGRSEGVITHLRAAASHPLTFYGVLAERQLGRDSHAVIAPRGGTETQLLRAFVASTPAARRAAALASVDEIERASAEIRQLMARAANKEELDQVLALADRLGVPAVDFRAGTNSADKAIGQFPIPGFAPRGGFRLDKALILAIIRQESRFNPRAVSRSNARGLMQLLPSTAAWITGDAGLRTHPNRLFDPATNLAAGQKYMEYLLDETGGDLLLALAAYNAGPGTILRWTQVQKAGADPLLIVESLPRAETRDYVEKVLANYWLYRQRLGEEDVSLEQAIAGEPLQYQSGKAVDIAAARIPPPVAKLEMPEMPVLSLPVVALPESAPGLNNAGDTLGQLVSMLATLPALQRR